MSASMTATDSDRRTEGGRGVGGVREAELAWIPTCLRAVGDPPVNVPPWLLSLLPALPPCLHAPFPLTLGTQSEKHQEQT